MQEQIATSLKKGRGMAAASLDLIDRMHEFAQAAAPITGRGVGYKLFAAGLIPDMSRNSMQRVYRLLKEARERDHIPWEWVVDETRELEKVAAWTDPEDFVQSVCRQYRREFWDLQEVRVEVWSEKGTVRGVLDPVLDKYGVGFRVMHGFNGATDVYNVAQDDDGRQLIALYVGDFDPSGMCMSEHDLPKRLEKYGGEHVCLRRIAIEAQDLDGLSTFPASDKKNDPRYNWFVKNYGDTCAELDAMDPNELRNRVEDWIREHIEWETWERCQRVQAAEQESLLNGLSKWASAA